MAVNLNLSNVEDYKLAQAIFYFIAIFAIFGRDEFTCIYICRKELATVF